MTEYEYVELKKGDLVEFPKNGELYRYGIVTGGFGMSLDTIGSKIYGVFGETVETAKRRWVDYLKRELEEEKQMKETGKFTINLDDIPHYEGYTRRQKCRVIEKREC